MSEMEIFYGVFRKSDERIEPEDTDDFYALKEKNKKHYAKVRGQLYEFYSLKELDQYGFSLLIPPSDETRFVCYWYNGGAGIHEIVENLIESSL